MPLSSIPETEVQNHQRPGKQWLPIAENPRSFRQQLVKTKAWCCFSTRWKIEVLSYWATLSIPEKSDPTLPIQDGRLRCHTIEEVSIYFCGIRQSCISNWRRSESNILNGVRDDMRVKKRPGNYSCRWPKMEQVIFMKFLKERENGQIIRRGGFRNISRGAFHECYL